MHRNIASVSCVVLISFSLVAGKNITFTNCDDEVSLCELHGLWMVPCPNHNGDVCHAQLGKKSSVTIDLTWQFSATELQNKLYWHKGRNDIPFMDMGTDACELTQCPVEANQRRTMDIEILVRRKYPTGIFNINWKIWNKEDETQQCCVNFDIKLVRQ